MTSTAFAPTRIDTLIGASTRIDGDIACAGVLRVQGEVKGDIECKEGPGGGLIVDSAGSVAGAANAPHIVVRGRLAGPAHSSRSVEVHQGASLVGDVCFRQLSIHAGGIVEGALTPTAEDAEPAPEPPLVSAQERRFAGKPLAGIAAAFAAVALVGAWAGGWLPSTAPTQRDSAPPADAPAREPEAPAPATRPQPAQQTAAVSERTPADAAANAVDESPQGPREETVTVNGANPNRPAGVFLLVAHEAAVLHRKRGDEAGNGTRLAAEAGEKVSIAIDAGDLIRVAKGSALEIYFQGQKVPRSIVERGVWIRFVPKPAPAKTGA